LWALSAGTGGLYGALFTLSVSLLRQFMPNR
jgi:hypothetical protein